MTSDRVPVEGEETLGARVRRLRLAKRLSQRELAGPGVDDSYIAHIERDRRTPSLEVLQQLAGRLGVDPYYLKTGSAVTPTKERELRLAGPPLSLPPPDGLH